VLSVARKEPNYYALLNPRKDSGHSVLSSEPLAREFGGGILVESERIEITG